MTVRIDVDTTALGTASSGISNALLADYQQAIGRLYGNLHATSQTWRGADSTAFAAKVDSGRPSLDGVREVADAYIAMLNTARTSYESTQTGVTEMARKLPSGEI